MVPFAAAEGPSWSNCRGLSNGWDELSLLLEIWEELYIDREDLPGLIETRQICV